MRTTKTVAFATSKLNTDNTVEGRESFCPVSITLLWLHRV